MGWFFLAIFVAVFIFVILFRRRRGGGRRGAWLLDGIYMLMLALALLFLYSAADSEVFDDLRALSSLLLAVGHLAVVAVGIVLALRRWKHAWVIACSLGFVYILLTFWPAFYNSFLFPGSNSAEDLFTAVYDPDFSYLLPIAAAAVGMTFVVWLAVSFYPKKPLVFGGIVLGSVLLVCGSMVGVKFFLLHPAFAPAVDVGSFEYLAPVFISDQGWGFINERGEQVIPCQYEEITSTKACGNHFFYVVNEGSYNYLFNEEGECIHRGARSYTFFENEALIAVERTYASYGAIDLSGELVIDYGYSSIEALADDNGLELPTQKEGNPTAVDEKNELFIMYDEALSSDYLADAEGNVIIPPNRWMITFGEDQNYIKVDSKWGLISIGDGGYDGECGVFDREGNVVIPVENRILILDNENGWFFAQDPDGRCYYIDTNNREVLELDQKYTARKGFCKVRQY